MTARKRPDATGPSAPTDELEFHLEMLTQRYVADGLTPDDARARALARLGDIRAAARESQAILAGMEQTRQRRSWCSGAGQDLRHAIRSLCRAPGYVAIAVTMLALGTGASTTVFSVVDGVILRSAFADPDRLASVVVRRPDGQRGGLAWDVYERLVAAPPTSLIAVGTHAIASPVATRIDTPRRAQVVCLTASMPQVIATRPMMGRWFTAEDARTGAAVAIVSFNFWRRSLGGRPDALGRVIALDDVPVTVIGVMPAGFDGPEPRRYREIWVPYSPDRGRPQPFGCPGPGETDVPLARLRDGVSLEAATRHVNTALGASDIALERYSDSVVGDLRNPFNALIGAVLAVLLVAFANVTNLGLERLAGRRRELAIRMAIGATRARVVRETIAEHLIIALAGAALGIAAAFLTFDAATALLPEGLPNAGAVSLNLRVLAASVALAVLGGIGAGALSAWQTSAQSLRMNLAAGERGPTPSSTATRKVLVAAELALGMLLLVGALLMIRTYLTLRPSDPGFDPAGKYIALVRLPPGTATPARVAFYENVRRELRSTPGIRDVAATTSVPMRRSVSVLPASIRDTKVTVHTAAVSANYFDMLGIPVVSGRGLSSQDTGAARPVAVVNEAFVRQWFDGGSPLGATITLRAGLPGPHTVTIVGVVGDIRSFGQSTRIVPFVFMPLEQSIQGNAFFAIHADARAAATLPAALRSAVDRIAPGRLVDEIEPLLDEMHAEVAQPRLGAWLFGLFAGLAVLLGAVGLAATLAWSVAQRRREIGVRMALGARAADVRALIVGQMLRLSVSGVAVGLLAAAASTRLIETWLYGVTPLDPATFAVCGAAMLAISAVAAYVPARRATRVNPVEVLRN